MISVIIPTYNTVLLIERAVRSVLNQNGEPDIEILIVDDCSTDNTLEVVREIGDHRIRIFQQERNQGPAAARNRGLREVKGEYCAFLDGDDYWEPEFLQKTSAFLNEHPEAVAVNVMQCHKIIGKEPAISPRGTEIEEPVVLDDFYAFWAKYNHVCTGSVLMQTDIVKATGGQREDLRICEDLEFWALLATYGKWGFIPEVLFTSDGGEVTKKQGWLEKNKKRWASAVPMAEWKKRIDARISTDLISSFEKTCGRIATGMAYSLLLSGRISVARNEVKQYSSLFTISKMSKLMILCSKNIILWYIFSKILYMREWRRCLK